MEHFVGQSFTAQLVCGSAAEKAPVSIFKSPAAQGSGWLVHDCSRLPPVRLRFDYVTHTEDRHHYSISACDNEPGYQNCRLEVSRNGYLGLYASGPEFWKLELVGDNTNPEVIDFVLRDHRGHVVRRSTEWYRPSKSFDGEQVHYLNVDKGEDILFHAHGLIYV